MSVRVWLPPLLRDPVEKGTTFGVESGSLEQVLDRLGSAAEQILAPLREGQGIAARWTVFVNDEVVNRHPAEVQLSPGDEISIVPAVRGGH